MSDLKPIETVYNGYHFRSRLEARWAVFFDALHLPYEYEKEGYDLGNVGWYLPDFWLPTVTLRGGDIPGLWVEIKGKKPIGIEDRKAEALAKATERPVILFVGLPCSVDDRGINAPDASDNGYEWRYWGDVDECDVSWDCCMGFEQCHNTRCGQATIEFYGNGESCPKCGNPSDDKSPALLKAYNAARYVRFGRR